MFGFKLLVIVYIFIVLEVVGVYCRYVFKINGDVEDITSHLLRYDFKDMLKITPHVFSFEYSGHLAHSELQLVLAEIKRLFRDEIIEIEKAKNYTTFIPMGTNTNLLMDGTHNVYKSMSLSGPKYDERANYFGMHVDDAWNKGFNGIGIKVAVVDIGVNSNIVDLQRNLDMDMAYNFINRSKDVTPEDVVHNYKAESISKIDHGNRCASIIAAEKGNGVCNAGIAYAAKVVPLKIFSLSHEYNMLKIHTTSDVMAEALAYRNSEIAIYSNSWSPLKKFEPLDLAMREVILQGTTLGRDRLGTIYVVPDGSEGITGSGIANSLYTITVNSVGVGGTLPSGPEVSACVITCGLSDGNKLHSKQMMTSSYNNKCVKFKGVSAAVPQVSAIIAFILQASPDLTLRDVQLILAESSDREGLAESNNFIHNAAGKYYHPVLGYGLLNADKAVSVAATWQIVGKLYNETLTHFRTSTILHRHYGKKYISILEFKMTEDPCNDQVNTIEHVMLHISYRVIKREYIHIAIISPSGTLSHIVDNKDGVNIDEDTSPRTLISTHFIGESPIGSWKVKIEFGRKIATKHLGDLMSLTVFGTYNETKRKHAVKCTSTTVKPTSHVALTTKHSQSITHNGGTTTDMKQTVTKGGKPSSASQGQLLRTIVYVLLGALIKYVVIDFIDLT